VTSYTAAAAVATRRSSVMHPLLAAVATRIGQDEVNVAIAVAGSTNDCRRQVTVCIV